MSHGDQREQADDVAEHLGRAVAEERAVEGRSLAARMPGVVRGQRRKGDGGRDHGVGGHPEPSAPGPVGERGQRMPEQLDKQVGQDDHDRDGHVPAQDPDRAERPDREQRGRYPGEQDVRPSGQRRGHDMRRCCDRDQLEDPPAEALEDVERGGQVGEPGPEQATEQHHGRRPGAGAGQPGQRDRQGPEHGAKHDGGQRCGERQLRGAGAARLQHEDRPGEAEQAHSEVAPQPELVERAERLRDRFGERARHLGVPVSGDGDERLGHRCGSGCGRHDCLPTPALPGQVQTVGGAGLVASHPLSPVSPSSRVDAFDITSQRRSGDRAVSGSGQRTGRWQTGRRRRRSAPVVAPPLRWAPRCQVRIGGGRSWPGLEVPCREGGSRRCGHAQGGRGPAACRRRGGWAAGRRSVLGGWQPGDPRPERTGRLLDHRDRGGDPGAGRDRVADRPDDLGP